MIILPCAGAVLEGEAIWMGMLVRDYVGDIGQDRDTEFCRSILKGVEIKRCRNSSNAYKPHVHQELSLGYILEGSTDLSLNETPLLFGAGDGVVIPPLMTHRCAPKNIDSWAYVLLYVDPEYYSEVLGFRQAQRLTGEQALRLTGFIEQLLTEKNPDMLESVLIELLLEFADNDPAGAPADADDATGRIREYILSHAKDAITLEILEQMSGLSRFSIIRGFKKLYLTTPAAYHLQHRVAEAKRLLGKGAGVLDVCEELGFYDQAHFIREFKKMYGVTPGAYQEQVKD